MMKEKIKVLQCYLHQGYEEELEKLLDDGWMAYHHPTFIMKGDNILVVNQLHRHVKEN